MSSFILENNKFIVEIDKRPPNKMFNNGWLCYGKNTKRLIPFPIKDVFSSKYKSCIETDNAIFFFVGFQLSKFKDHTYKCTYEVRKTNKWMGCEYKELYKEKPQRKAKKVRAKKTRRGNKSKVSKLRARVNKRIQKAENKKKRRQEFNNFEKSNSDLDIKHHESIIDYI